MRRTHCTATAKPITLAAREQEEGPLTNGKPRGFWYECDGDWRRWCRGESWGLGALKHIHSVELGASNILRLTTAEAIVAFHEEYGHDILDGRARGAEMIYPRWSRVAEQYDGIEIAPYQWSLRLALGMTWYYGWDCASGCLWRPAADAFVTYLGPTETMEAQGWTVVEEQFEDEEASA